MKRLRTLRGRLTALALLVTAIAVALLVLGFNLILAYTLRGDAERRLRAQAAAASTTVHGVGNHLELDESPNDGAIDARVWVFEGRRLLEGPATTAGIDRTAAAMAGGPKRFVHIDEPGTKLFALPVTHRGRRLGTIVAAESLAAYDRTTAIALTASLALGVLVLVAVYLVTWLTIGRALEPVADMTRSAAEWSERDMDRRFGSSPRPDELGRLAATFDALLDRLASSLRHEQRLSAELSHELRTPLAGIIAEVELLQRRERSPEERSEALATIARSAEQMRRILETLMAAARAETAARSGRSALAPTLAGLAGDWEGPLAERGVTLEVAPATGLEVGADAAVVERVIAPLLDNAGRHAKTRVTIGAGRSSGRVLVHVHDDGPGIDAGAEEAIFEPGRRGPRTAGDDGGAGLGLALARRLARSAGGDVTATADGPGATFTVELPA